MISQLIEKIKKTNAPICVGLDPMLSYVPEHVVKKSLDTCGETLEGAADAIWQFNKEIIDHTFDLIPAVKPQIAMYEQFGIEGLTVYTNILSSGTSNTPATRSAKRAGRPSSTSRRTAYSRSRLSPHEAPTE